MSVAVGDCLRCRECYWASAAEGSTRYCRALMMRVCIDELSPQKKRFCKFVERATARLRLKKPGDVFVFAGRKYRALTAPSNVRCSRCALMRLCCRPELKKEFEDVVGVCRGLFFEKYD